MAATTIYQRTQAGRDEIQSKQAGLTQSERQVLILIDGVTPCMDVRSKLAALNDERFERALRALVKLGLVTEVFLPLTGQVPEQLDKATIERFLHQELTDPVTIISYDPEEDFGDLRYQAAEEAIPELDVIVAPVPAVDEAHARLADSLQEELLARQQARKQASAQAVPVAMSENVQSGPAQSIPVQAVASPKEPNGHWGYWSIGLGIIILVSFFIARFLR